MIIIIIVIKKQQQAIREIFQRERETDEPKEATTYAPTVGHRRRRKRGDKGDALGENV